MSKSIATTGPLTEREAACCCGALALTARGEPVRMGLCHCADCQRRTGSVFGVQAWFESHQVDIKGEPPKIYVRTAESGRKIDFRFCAQCGTTLWWTAEQRPGWIGIAAGTFVDTTLPAPAFSSYERYRPAWTTDMSALPLTHHE